MLLKSMTACFTPHSGDFEELWPPFYGDWLWSAHDFVDQSFQAYVASDPLRPMHQCAIHLQLLHDMQVCLSPAPSLPQVPFLRLLSVLRFLHPFQRCPIPPHRLLCRFALFLQPLDA